MSEIQDRLNEIQVPISDEKLLEIKSPFQEDPKQYRVIAHLMAFSASESEIATMTGFELGEVTRIMALLEIKDMAFEIQKQYSNRDFETLFKALLPNAIDVTRHIMLDKSVKDSTRLSAAFGVMDRALGKPKQNVEVGGSLIRDLFERMDREKKEQMTRTIELGQKRGDTSDGEFKEVPKQTDEKNAMDEWVGKNIK